jgi:hypothetical protein
MLKARAPLDILERGADGIHPRENFLDISKKEGKKRKEKKNPPHTRKIKLV